jgi:palmitoyltransferase
MEEGECEKLLEKEGEHPVNIYEPWVHGDCKDVKTTKWYGVCLLLVIFIIVANYAVYVLSDDAAPHIASIVIFHVLLCLLLISWIQTIVINPGTVPQWWSDQVQLAYQSIPDEINQKFMWNPNYKLWKPPRSHNDKVSKRLVLNMDHFCPWVFNTVGFYNRKFFVLFLFYTWVTTGLVVGTSAHRFMDALHSASDSDLASLFVFSVLLMDALICVVLFGFWCYHMMLISINSTTVEQQASNPLTKYDVGWFRNMSQVFGKTMWLWLLPVWGEGPAGNGIVWPTNEGTMDGRIREDKTLIASNAKDVDLEAPGEAKVHDVQ